jgi:6-phosphogluconolactonase
MKFTKFCKALLIGALSAGVVLSVTSCVQSYSVGYLYVTGTVTSESNGNGIVSGFKIDHNTGKLSNINGMPVSSGGANPVRALLLSGSNFLYVLNQGASADGKPCTADDPCQGANITQFAVGANGILTPQETFYTQGLNPFRMITDFSAGHVYVLDHDSLYNGSASSATNPNPYCAEALAGATICGDITVFSVTANTGRLQLVPNSPSTGVTLPYFPVPANPIDFTFGGANILTLTGTPATGDTVYPYTYVTSTGGLTASLTSSDSIGSVFHATAIVSGGGFVFVLDDEPPPAPSLILPWTVGTNGALTAAISGPIADDANQSNPIYLVVENKSKWFYVANQGDPNNQQDALSGIAGYVMNNPFQPTEIAGTPIGFGAGAGPVCLVEDPSNQFFYTANHDAATVTGQELDQNAGTLTPLSQSSKAPDSYPLTGQPSWCLVDGRTN